MSALDFPIPSQIGQVYTANGKTWVWDGVSWNNQTSGFSGSLGFTGSIGFTGSQGAGFTGSQGSTGFVGSQGFSGSLGFSGSQGDIGFAGSIGTQGITGFTGSLGFSGSQGDIGFTGSQGIQGIQGLGDTGFTGSLGFTGSQGIIGYSGSQGIQGITGYVGSQGDIGFVGSQGTQGITGFVGSQGVQGITGDVGFVGSQGIQGIQGIVGFTGSQGIQGTQGVRGIQGTIGFTGSQGIQGIQGILGFTGSQGVQGITGFTGSIGFTGSQGLTGDGVASGGTTGQYLVKNSNTNFDTTWVELETDLASVGGSIIPATNSTHDLGSATNRWKDIYLSGNSIFLGNEQITETSWTTVTSAVQTLGTMALQNSNSVSISGGLIDNTSIDRGDINRTAIGSTTPNTGAFTTLTASGNVTFDGGTLFVDSTNDRVGVGTTSPVCDLHVDGASARLRVGPNYTSGGDRDFIDLIADGTDTKILSNNERFIIENNSGNIILSPSSNVGIGTETPSTKLTVRDNGFSLKVEQSTDSTQFLLLSGNQVQANQSGSGSPLYLNYSSGGNIYVGSGNLGLGTTSPSQKLHIVGTGFASSDFRAPIFYDSDNTAFYVDPASTGTSISLNGSASIENSIFFTDERSGIARNFVNTDGVPLQNGLAYFAFNHNTAVHPLTQSQYNDFVRNSTTSFRTRGVWTNSALFTLDADNYHVEFHGYLLVTTTGTYTFGTNSDDASDIYIDGQRVADHYGGHGATAFVNEGSNGIYLERGYHKLFARFEEVSGGDSILLGWNGGSGSTLSQIPSGNLWHDAKDRTKTWNGVNYTVGSVDIDGSLTVGGTQITPTSTTAGAVGTYCFASGGFNNVSLGNTVSGDILAVTGAIFAIAVSGFDNAQVAQSSPPLTGTWRCMGTHTYSNGNTVQVFGATLWLRIS